MDPGVQEVQGVQEVPMALVALVAREDPNQEGLQDQQVKPQGHLVVPGDPEVLGVRVAEVAPGVQGDLVDQQLNNQVH